MTFFMTLNETEIARQLTLIDFKIFRAIEVIFFLTDLFSLTSFHSFQARRTFKSILEQKQFET